MLIKKRFISPLFLPIIFFGVAILFGAAVIRKAGVTDFRPLSWTDAFFTATSSVCVTGLTVIDTGSYFTRFGQSVILFLIQIGGLGIMTFTSLAIYLWRHKVSVTDRIAVGRNLLHNPNFNLGKFLISIVTVAFIIELSGAFFLYINEPKTFSFFSAFFHSVSAFCNAGFSLFDDSLITLQKDWSINLIFILLIFLGGIGFSILIELQIYISEKIKYRKKKYRPKLSWYAKTVISTSVGLIIIGTILLYLSEFIGHSKNAPFNEAILTSFFQSVTCRTAGFNTVNIAEMTNVSLVIMLFLMFVGGAPGSCAGGLKVTTLRVLIALTISQLKGVKQAVIRKFAVNEDAVKKAVVLFILSVTIIFIASFLLDFTLVGGKPHYQVRGQFLEILFESVSAFATVGLSAGITPTLTTFGKWVLIFLMFIGRLGPLLFIAALQSVHKVQYYSLPEENPMIG